MYVIIVGGGQLGVSLARVLIATNLEVLIIEKSTAIATAISEELGPIVLKGDGCEVAVLSEAGTSRADLFVAVTGDDADNLVACQVAKHMFHVPHTMARVRDPRKEPLFQKLGVDTSINTTELILERLKYEILPHAMLRLLRLKDYGVTLVSTRVPPKANFAGRAVASLPLPPKSKLLLILRRNIEPISPQLDTIVEQDDTLIILVPAQDEATLAAIFEDTTSTSA